jgi:hypothetical protein
MILADELAAFLESGVSITLVSCSSALVPSVARAKGCRVVRGSPARLRLLVSAMECDELLDDVRSTHALSVTFTHAIQHRTLQFKGRDAAVDLPQPEDLAITADYERNFGDSILPIGFSRTFTHAFLNADSKDLQAIEFTPADVYLQTPGPNAGAKLPQP